MAQGNAIIVTENPKGTFSEVIISGTPKPGTILQIKAATEPVGGVYTAEVYNPDADGNQRPIMILLDDKLQGVSQTTAYTTGKRAPVYFPIAGEEFNILAYAAGTGTGDSTAIGDLFIVDKGTGHLVATTGTPESEPFMSLETDADLTTTAELLHMMYTGY